MSLKYQAFARQKITSRTGSVFGYELLRREHLKQEVYCGESGSSSTADVIVHALINVGWRNVSKGLPLFINVDKKVLMSPIVETITGNLGYIELLENIEIDAEVISRVKDLRSRGYKFALDDVFSLEDERLTLIEYVDIVKVDVISCTNTVATELLRKIHEADKIALAEKVETFSEFEYWALLGFDLFQGYAHGYPQYIATPCLPGSSLMVLNRMMQLIQFGFSTEAMAMCAMTDPALVLQLLLATCQVKPSMGSATEGQGCVKDLLDHFPRHQLKAWVVTLIASRRSDGNPDIWHVQANHQAKFMQMAAQQVQPGNAKFASNAFFLGLIAHYKCSLHLILDDATREFNLQAAIVEGWQYRKGPLGALLDLYDSVRYKTSNFNPTYLDINRAFKDSLPSFALEKTKTALEMYR